MNIPDPKQMAKDVCAVQPVDLSAFGALYQILKDNPNYSLKLGKKQ